MCSVATLQRDARKKGGEKMGSRFQANSMPLQELRAARFKFLHALYERSGGDGMKRFEGSEIAAPLALDEELASKIMDYLKSEGLIKYWAFGPTIGITHAGVVEVEQAIEAPDRPTEHFPPVINIIHIGGDAPNAVFQQGSPGAQQSAHVNQTTVQDIRNFLTEIKANISQLVSDGAEKCDLEADVESLEA